MGFFGGIGDMKNEGVERTTHVFMEVKDNSK